MALENTPWSDLVVGASASVRRVLTSNDLFLFAHASGNLNPVHLPEEAGEAGQTAVAPSMWLGAQISSVIGNRLPGPGTLYLSQDLRFLGRAHVGDEVVIAVTVTGKEAPRRARLSVSVSRSDGFVLAEGEALVDAPEHKIKLDGVHLPEIQVNRHLHADRLLEACGPLEPLPTAVVAPESDDALEGALMARDHNLILPILIGDTAKIEAIAAKLKLSLDGAELVHQASHRAAAAKAVEMVHAATAKAIMKGLLHTDELLGAVVKREGGLRTNRRLSHVFVMDVPTLPHLLLVTDAAINIAPTLEEKVDITQNAIDLAHALGMPLPKVGVLSAVETVNPKIPSTLDAAILSKMAERGQIRGGLVDGPLAMDNAISLDAARTKGITGLVAGMAQILVVPNLESGNILAKELAYVAHAEGAGIVLGAKVPIMLTSRADGARSRLISCAVAVLSQHYAQTGRSAVPEAV